MEASTALLPMRVCYFSVPMAPSLFPTSGASNQPSAIQLVEPLITDTELPEELVT